jgi:DNA repair protein RecO (recombination protein O)
MIESTKGVVLRTRPLTETSLIVQWLTADFGRIATVAKGVRRPKSPFMGKLDLFYEADFTFSRSRRSELHTLRELSLRKTHPELRQELKLLQQAGYSAALVEQNTETETPLPGIYELFREFLEALTTHPPRPQTALAFELKLLNELGQQPDFSRTELSAGSRRIVSRMAADDWLSIARLKPGAAQTMELSRFLHGYLIYHLGRIPKGRSAAVAS